MNEAESKSTDGAVVSVLLHRMHDSDLNLQHVVTYLYLWRRQIWSRGFVPYAIKVYTLPTFALGYIQSTDQNSVPSLSRTILKELSIERMFVEDLCESSVWQIAALTDTSCDSWCNAKSTENYCQCTGGNHLADRQSALLPCNPWLLDIWRI